MNTEPKDPLDELCQIRDELRVVWLALINPDSRGYTTQVGEHVNVLTDRLGDLIEQMADVNLKEMSEARP